MVSRILKKALILVALAILCLPATIMALPTAEIWESLTATDDSEYEVYGNTWLAQTFTVGAESHSVSQVRLKMYREGSPGTVTVSITETDSGLPIGEDLTSGTINGDNLSTGASGTWYAVNLTDYSLEEGVKYAIVIRAEAGDASNSIHIRYDGSAGAYADGSEINTTNGGVTWAADTDDDLMFEVWGSALIELTQAQVYRGYVEDDDMLIVIQYYNTYVPYYPNEDTASYFVLQLRSTDGVTVLAETTCKAWGYKPGSIYLSANGASGLTSGSAYRIYIYGIDGGNPEDYYSLQGADWRGDDLNLLDIWVLTTAHTIGDYYDTDLTTFLTGGSGEEVLNTEGGVIFDIGIPALSTVRPNLYELAGTPEGYDPENWTNAFDTDTTWTDQVGDTVGDAMTSIGDIFGVDGKAVGAFAIMAVYLGLATILVTRGVDPFYGLVMGIPFVLLGSWFRFIDMTIVAVFAAVFVLLLVFRFWFSRG